MVTPREVRYELNTEWDGLTGGIVKRNDNVIISFDTPVEFGGNSRAPCPDELFLSSIAGCLTTTFLFFMRRFKLRILSYNLKISGSIMFRHGRYEFTDLKTCFKIRVNKGLKSSVLKCLNLTVDFCHITNALKMHIKHDFNVEEV
ncbi:MAG: OsmC family protein [Candidatus Methanomethylicia archaeon]